MTSLPNLLPVLRADDGGRSWLDILLRRKPEPEPEPMAEGITILGYDPLVVETSDGSGLALKAPHPISILEHGWSQFFEGHQPVQLRISGPVDNGESPLPNLFQNLVST